MSDPGYGRETPWQDDDPPPFTKMPNAFLRDGTLSPGAKVVYAILKSYVGANVGVPAYPGQDRLAEEVGCSEKTVRKYLDELEERNLIQQVRSGATKTNRYHVKSASGRKMKAPDAELSPKELIAIVRGRQITHGSQFTPEVLKRAWVGVKTARARTVENFLRTAPRDQVTKWLEGHGFPYRLIAMICAYCEQPLPAYSRPNIEEWLKTASPHHIADFLWAFAEDELKTVLTGFTPDEIKALRAKYQPKA